MLGSKGEKVVKKNWDMVDAALGGMQQVDYPKDKWLKLESERNAVQKRLIRKLPQGTTCSCFLIEQ